MEITPEIQSKLEQLSDKYAEELGPKSVNVTREEIEDFLKRNEKRINQDIYK
jgi:hypothetical protein